MFSLFIFKLSTFQNAITNFFGQSSTDNEKELDDLFTNLKDTFDDDLMLEISQKSKS